MTNDIRKLSKYDKFYRIVGNPLYKMNIEDFIGDLDNLIWTLE